MSPDARSRVLGCLFGGAVGDALGAPIEFLSLDQIRVTYGPDGIRDPADTSDQGGRITDETQLTLFTAEGLIRARTGDRVEFVHQALLRWLDTQDFTAPGGRMGARGWLVDVAGLRQRRGPGMSTLASLGSGVRGTRDEPINESKGSGAVVRVAPLGLVAADDPFELGCDLGATTHGHPTGWLAAGAQAHLIWRLMEGDNLESGLDSALARLAGMDGHEECTAGLQSAISAASDTDAEPAPEAVTALGEGWVADETLAMAAYCSLVAGNDFAAAVRLAANHSGNSDGTSAVTGTLLGALHGIDAVPADWRDTLGLADVIETVGEDLMALREGREADPERYPAD